VDLIERIQPDEVAASMGHQARYRLAAGYIDGWDEVLDAAAGIGYGASLGKAGRTGIYWHAADREDVVISEDVDAVWEVDLSEWEPPFAFDVALSFETIEHVDDYGHLIDVLCQARRHILASVPIIPTVGANPFHVHDFTEEDLPREFEARGWKLEQMLLQPSEFSAVYVFHRA
jgi:hypothetical protein